MFPLFKLILKLYIHQSTTVNTVNAVSFPYLQEIFTHATISHTVAIYKHILRIVHFCKLCFLDQVRTATYFWFALNSLYCLLRSCHLRLPVRVRPRLGSFVVEIPSITWSYSGFTEMGCYKPSPATWVVAVCQYICFFGTFLSHPRDDTIQKCCESGCWWFYRTPWYSQGLYQFLGV